MKKFLIALAVVGMAFTLTACNNKKNPPRADYTEDPKTTANTTADIIAEKEVDGIKFSSVSVIRENNLSRVSVQIMNTTTSPIAVKSIQIIYKDENGKLYVIGSMCPHPHGELKWNSDSCYWECPCHGSQFDIYGKVISAPSTKHCKSFEK